MELWSSRLGFILAAIGAAVGLGNIWRFPAVVGANGGGAYLLPYLIAAFGLAVPLMILEISVGRSLRADIVTACRQIRREFEIVGWLIGAANLAILSYYLVITGWVLAFFLAALSGRGLSFESLTAGYVPIVLFVGATLLVGAIVSLGVQSGIERMSRVLIPMTFLILIALAAYVATMDGFIDGLRFFLTPDTTTLQDPGIWSAAFGQVFFSFSVGMGVMLTYGSYLGADANVPRSALTIALADLLVAMLAGIIIFGIVFSFGLETTSGTELAFVTLPAGFEAMPFGGVIGVAFFGLLFFAAIAPSVSMLEVGVAGVMRATDLSRRRATLGVTGVILVAGFPSAASYSALEFSVLGRPFLDVLDASVGTYALPLAAITLVIVFTWVQEPAALRSQLGDSPVRPIVTYLVPAVLGIVTGLQLLGAIPLGVWRRVPDFAMLPLPHTVVTTLTIAGMLGIIGWGISRIRSSGRTRRS